MQDIPTGRPSIVSPIEERIDIHGLTQDIPKFTPWISPAAATEWETFLTELPSLVSREETETEPSWTMEDVFTAAESVDCQASTTQTTTITMPENTMLRDMFESQQAPCQVQ